MIPRRINSTVRIGDDYTATLPSSFTLSEGVSVCLYTIHTTTHNTIAPVLIFIVLAYLASMAEEWRPASIEEPMELEQYIINITARSPPTTN